MPDLYITKAHPNPAGKDKPGWDPPINQKLNEEWVEFKNITRSTLKMDGVSLFHRTFNQRCEATGDDNLNSFSGQLGPSQSVRVHTGSGQVYLDGETYHLYAGRSNFAWNNKCGDRVTLRVNGALTDWASYDPYPPDGIILHRMEGINQLG